MSLVFKKAGILTTVQDLGRFGHQRFGVNPTGAMDTVAARIANLLVANNENDAVIEMHFPAAAIVFERDTIASIAGAEFDARLDEVQLANWSAFVAKAGSTLRFVSKTLGNRAYLAVSGGLAIEKWLGSFSTNLAANIGGFEGRRLRNGDVIQTNEADLKSGLLRRRVSPSLLPLYRPFPTVRVIAGAEYEMLDAASKQNLETQNYLISSTSNRMGFRLGAEPLRLSGKIEMLSSAVSYGTIQLLPDGHLIALMAAHQTSGGYPRVAHVITRDLPLIGQLGPGDKLAFHLVELSHAEELACDFEREIAMFRVAAGARPKPCENSGLDR